MRAATDRVPHAALPLEDAAHSPAPARRPSRIAPPPRLVFDRVRKRAREDAAMDARTTSAYDRDLDKNPANYAPLTPLSFLARSAAVFPDRIAVIHGQRRTTYADFYARARRLASALSRRGVGKGDTVSAMLAN